MCVSGYFCTIWDCVVYFTRVRKSFWIASLAKTPLCFPFQLFCSCASAFRLSHRVHKRTIELRKFRGLMAYAEVAVRRKHDRMQHRTAITQPLTGYWWLQWKWSFRTFFFFFVTAVVKITLSNDFRKEPVSWVELLSVLKLKRLCCIWDGTHTERDVNRSKQGSQRCTIGSPKLW